MGLVRVSPLDRQYDLRFFKCERCKCEVCLHTETVNSRSETAKEQSETGMIRAAIKKSCRDELPERTHDWTRATPIAAVPNEYLRAREW